MRRPSFNLEDLLMKLSMIPGCRFLQRWVMDYRESTTQYAQEVGDWKNVFDVAGEGISDVTGGIRGAGDEGEIDESGNFVPRSGSADEYSYASEDSYGDAGYVEDGQGRDGFRENFEDVFYDDWDD